MLGSCDVEKLGRCEVRTVIMQDVGKLGGNGIRKREITAKSVAHRAERKEKAKSN